MNDIPVKRIAGILAAFLLLMVLLVAVTSVDWSQYTDSDVPQELPTFPTDDEDSIWDGDSLKEDSLAYTVFEKYGLVLIPLALLMFGAMVGGVVISREEADVDDTD